jgi:hypothetical protein
MVQGFSMLGMELETACQMILGSTCSSMNGNVRRCTIIKDYVRRLSILSMQPQEHQEHRLVRHHLVFQQD